MNWRDYFSIRLIIALTMITYAVANFPDDTNDKHKKLRQPVTTKSMQEKKFEVNTEKTSASYDNADESYVEEEEEVEGVGGRQDVDEYEEELRDIAESHEAMSRDDRDNSTDIINHSEISVSSDEISVGVKNFDSHEKSVEDNTDESVKSNEAISGEPEEDTEVEQLMKFKREEKRKMKRVPTVKKELSSQKEIQENNTESNATMEILNGFGRTQEVISNHVLDNEGTPDESQVEQRSLRGESGVKYEYTDLDGASKEILREVDKRQESDVKGLEAYPLSTTHARDFSKQKKLWELETDEYTLAESLMELLVKLAENPRHWERAHKLLKDIENDLKLRRTLDSDKLDYQNVNGDMKNLLEQSSLMKEPELTSKKPKKKKKKKKKPRYELLTTSTMSTIPLTTIKPMTTSTEATTHANWRLVADRLFGPSWSSRVNDRAPSNVAKVHYAISSKQHVASLSNQRDSNSEYMNDETPGNMDANLKYPRPRKFHFGKINTHEKGSSLNQHDPNDQSSYESDTSDASDSQVLGYDLSDQTYQGSRDNGDRYDQYDPYVGERTRHYGDEYVEDYQDPVAYPTTDFSRHRGYYDKSWKFPKYDMSRGMNPYYDSDRNKWISRYGAWQTFWHPMVNMDNKNNDESRIYGKFGSWPPEKSMRTLPWRSIGEVPRVNDYSRDVGISDKNRNHSELNDALKTTQEENDNSFVPKITMKTWNSLTSDPATWPFKLPDVKPWPKDKYGKSYNPNADLVRKLGLDDQEHNSEHGKINHKNVKESLTKINNLPHENESQNWNKDVKMWPSKMSPKIQSVGAWIMPADQSTWKPYESKPRQSFQNGGILRWPDRTVEGNWQGKLTDWNVGFDKQTSNTVTWSPKWKQFSYHKVNAAPITKPGAQLEGAQKTRNAFIAVSAVSPSKYSGNEWRKNDIEETPVINSSTDIDADDPTTQLLHSHQGSQINNWKKHIEKNNINRRNETDPLEHQLEELRQNNLEKRNFPTAATYLLSVVVNSSATTGVNINNENKVMTNSTENQIKAKN